MTDIVLSIHPRHVENILSRKKSIEVRKTNIKYIFEGDRIYLYATAPIKKVVGHCLFWSRWMFTSDCPEWAFEETCLTWEELKAYIPWPQFGLFIEVRAPTRYSEPKDLSDFGLARPPQSFCYVKRAE